MSRIPIIAKTVSGQTALFCEVRIISMPLYPTTPSTVNIFYGYYKAQGKRIENTIAEGNQTLGNVISGASKTALLAAVTTAIGAYTEATLLLHSVGDTTYKVKWKKVDGSQGVVTVTGSYFSEDASIQATMLSSISVTENTSSWWQNRKSFVVNAPSSLTDYTVTITVHAGTGTSTGSDVYIPSSKVRSDWGDIRIRTSDAETNCPYAIVSSTASSITLTFLAPSLANGNNTFYLHYNRPQVNVPYKIACLTDTHYDPLTSSFNRDQTLTFIDNFVTRMATYLPDLAVNNGDKTGASSGTEATQLSWYQSNIDHFAAVTATVKKDGVAPGNHDFEFLQFSNIVAKHSGESWMQSGKLYGYWESTDFRFIALDSNYQPSGQSHLSLQHNGYGYINTDQITWLTATLASSTKPCIIFCHHPLAEFDTASYTLTKETYHTQNRTAVRTVLETSGKVACVLHGHVHWHRWDIINSIPYLCMEDISESSTLGFELPTTTTGKWNLIEIDREACSIRHYVEYRIAGVATVVYDRTVPYKTSFDTDIANHPERVSAFGYGATYAKSSVLADPAQLYINNYGYINTIPSNIAQGDPRLSGRTMKIQGLANGATFGRATWDFTPQTGKFRLRFSVRLVSQTTKYFKLLDASNATPAVFTGFATDGNIIAYNGASLTNLMVYTLNTWYEFDIRVDVVGGTYSVYVNNVIKANGFSFNNANTSLKQLEIVTETGNMFLDFLRIEKLITTEPTVGTWSAEQIA